ncbi:hypothetical protein [Amycolatopsis sp. EV170708-02-1]|uniref:hypothetical protein n=1 Tax=Amycolatopsis sp. EV170708-02-1 TaxID=2919322 RepID=UPI0037BE9DFB
MDRCRTPSAPAGAHELHGLPHTKLTLLGRVLDHHHPGRRTPTETTLFKSTGHGALDIATAAIIYTTARTRGLGTHLDL